MTDSQRSGPGEIEERGSGAGRPEGAGAEGAETEVKAEKPRGWFARFLAVVEWLGNCLPHPVTLFFILCVVIALVSALCAVLGVHVEDPRPIGARGRSVDGLITVKSVMSADGLRWLVENLVSNFAGFRPLGTVLVALLGVGVAEKSGLLSAAIRAIILAAPKRMVTMVIVFAGVVSNTASEMGYVVVIPLAMVIFHSMGRHPFAGLAAAFAGVSGGYSANLLIGTIDPLLAGITEEAARLAPIEGAELIEVDATANWYFMIASTFLITALGTLVTSRIVEPRLGKWDWRHADKTLDINPTMDRLTAVERKGLLWASVAAAGVCALIVWLAGPFAQPGGWGALLPGYGVLRDAQTNSIIGSPLLRGVVAFILVFFVVPGVVYGRVVGTIRNDRDVIDAMAASMSSMGLYIVLVFFAAQFVAIFDWTNLGGVLSVTGAQWLRDIGLTGPAVFVPFILMCAIVNLMLGSASAQWAVTAPIFVPMLMTLGYSPEVIQAAYRIGDSSTNIITPMMSYFGLILAMAARYDKRLGIGTLVSTMLPYSIVFLLGWMVLFYLWVFVLGIPVGVGTTVRLDG